MSRKKAGVCLPVVRVYFSVNFLTDSAEESAVSVVPRLPRVDRPALVAADLLTAQYSGSELAVF